MPCTANCHCALGRRTWVWQWTRGSEPVSGWVDTRDVVFVDSDGEQEPDNRPCTAKVAGCICSTIGNFIGSVLVVYLLWLIFFRPYKVRPHIDAASLAAFDLIPTTPAPPSSGNATALRYDLALNVTFFNDHRIYGIRFDHLTAGLYYNGTKLGPSDDTLPSFHQRPRRHRTVYPALRGQARNVTAAVAEQFAMERAQGRFNVDVRVKTTLTYRFWPTRATYYYEYDCWLQFMRPPGNGTPALTGGVKCGVHK